MPRIEPIPFDELPLAQREFIEQGTSTRQYRDPVPLQIMAYTHHEQAPDDGDRHPNFPDHLLGGTLLELLRIRSAQLGGCDPCMTSRKVDGATEDLVACMVDPDQAGKLSTREQLALEYLETLANDHFSIGDAMYQRLAEHFTTAEIVELGLTCGNMIGTHRFFHTLNTEGDGDPAIRYDPRQVGKTWDDLHAREEA
jgi:alkylhydroperoxidase family enzyme